MRALLRFLIIGILLCLYSFNINAGNTRIISDKKPVHIPIIKKPCYIGCAYRFPYCYYYNISNMNNAITVREWNVGNGFVTGKADIDIKAKLIIKVCYQLSLTAAYAVIDDDVDLIAEFEFKIKSNDDANSLCIEDLESSITYSSFELKGNLSADPIPIMKEHLIGEINAIVKDSVSKAVYNSQTGNKEVIKIYCGEGQGASDEIENMCPCY